MSRILGGKSMSLDLCADCSTLDPAWVSINRGVLLCDGCCSVHLSLGRHVSQIKSLKKGSWCSQQLMMVRQLAVSGANNIWEYTLLDPTQNRTGRRKPNPRDQIHPTKSDFIRAKYQFLAFVNKPKESEGITLDDLSKQLHASVRTANLETSLRLLASGADPNYVHPEKSNTALHVAALSNQPNQVELLLVYGADPGTFDIHGKTPSDVARVNGYSDLADRLIECQYELTDGLAFYLCGRRPDHQAGQHFLIPEVADSSLDLSELAKAAKKKLQTLSNHLFEELAMDVYDEVDRRENEGIWNSSQIPTMPGSDRQIVPFLPANPEFSATRNQGRQKLAKFNKREFATLIIDILNDAKRRYVGILSPIDISNKLPGDIDKSRVDRNASNAVGKPGNQTGEDPIYDQVCQEGDYASIDGESVKEEINDSVADALADQSDDLADFAVTMEDYVSLKRSLIESQKQCHNLTTELEESRTNCRKLTEEVAFLEDKVEKLLQENRNLRCVGSPVDVPTLTHINGNTTSRDVRRWTTLPGEGNTLVLSQQGVDVSQEFPSPPQDLLSPTGVSKSAEMVDSHSDNTKTKTIGTRSHSAEVTLTESTPLQHSQHVKAKSIGATSGVTPEITLPTQDDVVKKTEKITRTLQELFQTAQENKHDCFINCAEKIHVAVVEMAELFPKTSVSKPMLATLRMLTDGSNHLLELCSQSPPELNGVTDYRLHTNKVIQTAYDIAKAAKQLVMLFE